MATVQTPNSGENSSKSNVYANATGGAFSILTNTIAGKSGKDGWLVVRGAVFGVFVVEVLVAYPRGLDRRSIVLNT